MAFGPNSPVGGKRAKKEYAQGPNYTNASFSTAKAAPKESLISKIRYDLGSAIGLHRKTAANAANGGGPKQRFANGPAKAPSSGPSRRFVNSPAPVKVDTSNHNLSANSPAPSNNSPVGGAQASKRSANSGLPNTMSVPASRPASSAPVKRSAPAAKAAPKASAPRSFDQTAAGKFLAKIRRSA